MNYEIIRNNLANVYNKLSVLHDQERDQYYNNTEQLTMLSTYLLPSATVLDAGCGTGYPVVKFFHDLGHNVTGTDISPGQLEFVKFHAPFAKTIVCDTSELNFPDNTFDLVTSFYSLMHLPLERQIVALTKFYNIVKYNQPVYVTLATEEYTGEKEFSGTVKYGDTDLPIYHTTPEEYEKILKKIGYKNISLIKMDTGKDITLLWFFGLK
jgi:ubiquinone/menaquinone biosynthesis C-methylase UbiE